MIGRHPDARRARHGLGWAVFLAGVGVGAGRLIGSWLAAAAG